MIQFYMSRASKSCHSRWMTHSLPKCQMNLNDWFLVGYITSFVPLCDYAAVPVCPIPIDPQLSIDDSSSEIASQNMHHQTRNSFCFHFLLKELWMHNKTYLVSSGTVPFLPSSISFAYLYIHLLTSRILTTLWRDEISWQVSWLVVSFTWKSCSLKPTAGQPMFTLAGNPGGWVVYIGKITETGRNVG